MKPLDSILRHCAALGTAAALAATVPAATAHAQTTTGAATTAPVTSPAAPTGFARIHGVVYDSLNGGPLAGAEIRIEGTELSTTTGADGQYSLDSIPPGDRRLAILHPLLDTLGIQMVTRPLTFVAGTAPQLDLAVPTAEELAAAVCSRAERYRGPAALIGFVKDPDTGAPATGARVSLVYYENLLGKKEMRVRDAVADSLGHYRICGLPSNMDGKVQVFRGPVSSGEVPATVDNGFLATHSFSIASQVSISTVTDTSGRTHKVYAGRARVQGKVVSRAGKPIAGARISMDGTLAATTSRSDGEFTLDSLPSGTQSLTVRKLGYSPTYYPVELSAAQPQDVTIAMNDYVPTLAAMRTEVQAIRGLQMVGYTDRKRMGNGVYLDGSKLHKDASTFTQMLRGVPGIRIVPAGDGMHYSIVPTRGQSGCVNIYLDGTFWQQMQPGDIDSFVQPSEVAALEIYAGNTAPAEFIPPGRDGCATIVAWTSFTANKQRKP